MSLLSFVSRPSRTRACSLAASLALFTWCALVTGSSVRAQPLPDPRANDAQARAEDDDRIDPLIRRLDALGITDDRTSAAAQSRDPAETSDAPEGEGGSRPADVELHLVSDPPGYGLLATRSFEGRLGSERGLCRAPCTTWLDPGTYRLVVENQRGRDRAVPGLITLMNDGDLELHIESRRMLRFAWWTASLAMVGGGIGLFVQQQRQPQEHNGDEFCEVSCYHYSTRARALMTVGGITAMFGGIFVRYAIGARDVGHVVFHPVRLRTTTGTEDEGSSDP